MVLSIFIEEFLIPKFSGTHNLLVKNDELGNLKKEALWQFHIHIRVLPRDIKYNSISLSPVAVTF